MKEFHGKHPNFVNVKKMLPSQFVVRHYAEDVCYESEGFRASNLFVIRPEAVAMLLNVRPSNFFHSFCFLKKIPIVFQCLGVAMVQAGARRHGKTAQERRKGKGKGSIFFLFFSSFFQRFLLASSIGNN